MACAYALLVRAIPFVPAVQASLILMIEPALNPLLAFAVHGERPHPLALGGGVLIVGAVALASLMRRKGSDPEPGAASGPGTSERAAESPLRTETDPPAPS